MFIPWDRIPIPVPIVALLLDPSPYHQTLGDKHVRPKGNGAKCVFGNEPVVATRI